MLVETMAFVGRLNLVYIRIALESSVHPPYAAMMYCGKPDAASSVAPPYRSERVDTLLRGSPNSSHVDFVTSEIVSPFRIGNPGICHIGSDSVRLYKSLVVAIQVYIIVTMQMPKLSGWRQ